MRPFQGQWVVGASPLHRVKTLCYVMLPFQGIDTPEGGVYLRIGACPYLNGFPFNNAPVRGS